mmetsp:Transcript_17009/g.41229  ORF Transcript_17009/g.41229 Transcript_17009/m.41229 type:complete len:313 (-) Transcript_17009:114-1052(-)
MLANALLQNDGNDKTASQSMMMPFKQRMELMRMRAGVLELLQSRWDAIHVGQKLASNPIQVVGGGGGQSSYPSQVAQFQELSENDQLQVMWSHEPFRRKVEKAARLSSESHIWQKHNFACAPSTIDWLYHKMITAENTATGEVVGFCEVVMLPVPEVHEDGDASASASASDQPIPTIANMITSPEYRRRGIGSRLMTSATRFVKDKSLSTSSRTPSHKNRFNDAVDTPKAMACGTQDDSFPGLELSLFVEHDNEPAIAMYESLGFTKIRRVQKGQWYMSKFSNSVQSKSPESVSKHKRAPSIAVDDMSLAYI